MFVWKEARKEMDMCIGGVRIVNNKDGCGQGQEEDFDAERMSIVSLRAHLQVQDNVLLRTKTAPCQCSAGSVHLLYQSRHR